MNKEKLIPFTWKGWDEMEVGHFAYYEVEFLEDFGFIKAGEKFESIDVNYLDGYISIFNETGDKLVGNQTFKIVPN